MWTVHVQWRKTLEMQGFYLLMRLYLAAQVAHLVAC
jgi:hypothetical protein